MNEIGRVLLAFACTAFAGLAAYYLIVFLMKVHG
jgi:hypothetical protein